MTINSHIRILAIGFLLFLFSACNSFFETESDRDAQIALRKLITVQEKYRKDHNRYAKTLFEIEKENKYQLEYHKGLIYMEIERADENGFRAISLPAESTTARVFAHDPVKGGFYEMDDEETAQYVLGAFRSIQNDQGARKINDISALILITGIAFLGIYSLFKKRELGYEITYGAHFVSLGPLFFALAALNHMSDQIAFSTTLKVGIYGSSILASVCLVIFANQARRYYMQLGPTSLVGLLASIFLSAVFTIGTMVYILAKF